MPKTMRKTSLKIQMLAGNSLNVCPDSDSQKKLPLVMTSLCLKEQDKTHYYDLVKFYVFKIT